MQKIFYDNILGEINTSLIVDNKIDCVEYDEYQITEHVDVNAKKTFPAYEFIDNNYIITKEDIAFDEENDNNRYQIWNHVKIEFENPCNTDNLLFRLKYKNLADQSNETTQEEEVTIEKLSTSVTEAKEFKNYYRIVETTPDYLIVSFRLISKNKELDTTKYRKENTIEIIANYFKSATLTKYYPPIDNSVNVWKMPTNKLINNYTTITVKVPNEKQNLSDVEKKIPIGEYNAANIYDKYHKGRRTMSLSVVNRDYIEVNSKIFVTKMKQSEYDAMMLETDTVDKVDAEATRQAILSDNNGRARVFLVTKNEEVYDGAYVQKLELMEIDEKLSNHIANN